jgi:DNA recombination protein RmuC
MQAAGSDAPDRGRKTAKTLDERLANSFAQVSERLEQVHKGLGEMQTLATGVGDLKKVLFNVKKRAFWARSNWRHISADAFTRQYAVNVATDPAAQMRWNLR